MDVKVQIQLERATAVFEEAGCNLQLPRMKWLSAVSSLFIYATQFMRCTLEWLMALRSQTLPDYENMQSSNVNLLLSFKSANRGSARADTLLRGNQRREEERGGRRSFILPSGPQAVPAGSAAGHWEGLAFIGAKKDDYSHVPAPALLPKSWMGRTSATVSGLSGSEGDSGSQRATERTEVRF